MNSNFAIIQNLLDKKESERLQFFSEYNPKSISKCIVAMANSSGGDILVGISDDGKIVGVKLAEDIIQHFESDIKNVIVPEVALYADVFSKQNLQVILISVWEGSKKPYLFDNNIYVLRGGIIKIASPRDLNSLLNQRIVSDRNWEREIVVGSSIEDIDLTEIEQLIKKTKCQGSSPIGFLQQQGLMRAGSITNAGIVLFGKNPDKYLPQIRVRLNVFTGTSELADSKVYSHNLFKTVRSIIEDLDNVYGSRILIDGLYRKEVKAYPKVALREALLNALIHREIASPDCYVTVSVYPTHTDVVNKGTLMQGVTINSLKKEHMSILRNPDIAYFAYLNGLIEMAGSGTLRMIADCSENSFSAPKWTVKDDAVKVTFVGVRSKIGKPTLIKSDEFLVNQTSEKRDEVRKVLNYMLKNEGKATTKEIETVINKSLPTVKRLIKLMMSEGLMVYMGTNREGKYYLTDNI